MDRKEMPGAAGDQHEPENVSAPEERGLWRHDHYVASRDESLAREEMPGPAGDQHEPEDGSLDREEMPGAADDQHEPEEGSMDRKEMPGAAGDQHEPEDVSAEEKRAADDQHEPEDVSAEEERAAGDQHEPEDGSDVEKRGLWHHDHYVPSRDESLARVSDLKPEYRTRLKYAGEMAYITILAHHLHYPPEPMRVLNLRPNVLVYEYRRAADFLAISKKEFMRRYGHMEAFTVRHVDQQDHQYWAVVYRHRELIGRERYTLAHELAHVMMDHQGHVLTDEYEADHFASCFLAPRPALEIRRDQRVLTRELRITGTAMRLARRRRVRPLLAETNGLIHRWYRWEQGFQRRRRAYNEYIAREIREQRLFPVLVDLGFMIGRMYSRTPRDMVIFEEGDAILDLGLYPMKFPDVTFGIDAETADQLVEKAKKWYCDLDNPWQFCPRWPACGMKHCVTDWEGVYQPPEKRDYDLAQRLIYDLNARKERCPLLRWGPMQLENGKQWVADGLKDLLMIPGRMCLKQRLAGPSQEVVDEINAWVDATFPPQERAKHYVRMKGKPGPKPRRKAEEEPAQENGGDPI